MPNPVAVLFKEVAERITLLTDRGEAWLIDSKDETLAKLITNDSKLRSLCLLAGTNTIVVPNDKKAAFRRALRKLGYGVTA